MAEAAELPAVSVARVWGMHGEDWHLFPPALAGALCAGASQPVFAILYSDIISAYFAPDGDAMRARARAYLGWFFLLGGAVLAAKTAQISLFSAIGERLVRRLRRLSFEAALRQPVSLYDEPSYSVGRTCTRLATDATLVKGLTGGALGMAAEGFACLAAALVISFAASPRLAGVMMAVVPFLVVGSVYEFRNVSQRARASGKVLERSGEVVADAVAAARTVAAFNLQGQVLGHRWRGFSPVG